MGLDNPLEAVKESFGIKASSLIYSHHLFWIYSMFSGMIWRKNYSEE